MSENITIVKVKDAVNVNADRGGGQEHGVISSGIEYVAKSIDAKQFLSRIDEAFETVNRIAERLQRSTGEFSAEEINIGLSVSGEGTVGIATVGTEASIEVCFKRRSNAQE